MTDGNLVWTLSGMVISYSIKQLILLPGNLNGKPAARLNFLPNQLACHTHRSSLWNNSRNHCLFHAGPSNVQCPTFLTSRLINPDPPKVPQMTWVLEQWHP